MNNNIGAIVRKELKRFFGDKKLFFTTVIMPGLMIFLMYTLMGSFMTDKLTTAEDYQYKVVAKNLPDSISAMLVEAGITANDATESEAYYTDRIVNKELDLYMVFPEDFDNAIAAYDVTSGAVAPNVELYFLGSETNSRNSYSIVSEMLDTYESAQNNLFDVNSGEKQYNLASDKDEFASIMGSMIPMLILIFLYSGCIAVAPESIAGEKERGTIATLLVTPMKRSELATGKILSLAIIAITSAVSSFAGTMISLPKMMSMGEEMDTNFYSITDYIWVLPILLSSVLVLIALISMISASAKSVKEASTTVGSLMVIIVVVGLSGMMGSGAATNPTMYMIPIYNSIQAMTGIFTFHLSVTNILITTVANLIWAMIMVFGLTKMFESEKVMFSS